MFLGRVCTITKDHFSRSLRSNLGIIYSPRQWYKLKKSQRISKFSLKYTFEGRNNIFSFWHRSFIGRSILCSRVGVKGNKLLKRRGMLSISLWTILLFIYMIKSKAHPSHRFLLTHLNIEIQIIRRLEIFNYMLRLWALYFVYKCIKILVFSYKTYFDIDE